MPTSTLPLGRYAERIEADSALLAALPGQDGWDRAMPTCPGWRMEDLVRHLGAVHRWALTYVSQGLTEMFPQPTEGQMLGSGPGREELASWLRTGASELAAALRRSPPDLPCWTFLPAPSPLVFSARQAHETAVHRVDGELALGSSGPLPADFAADGVSELLLGFAHRSRRRLRREGELAAVLEAEDTGDRWRFVAPQGASRWSQVGCCRRRPRCALQPTGSIAWPGTGSPWTRGPGRAARSPSADCARRCAWPGVKAPRVFSRAPGRGSVP